MIKPYKLPKLHNAKGDLKKRWFVYYSFQHPVTGKFERFKIYEKINTLKTKKERTEYAGDIIGELTGRLIAGYTPFEVEQQQLTTSITTLSEAITSYLSAKETQVRKKTKTGYASVLGHFRKWAESRRYHSMPMAKITTEHIQAYFAEARKVRKIAATTHNSELNTIKAFFKYWAAPGRAVCAYNPADPVKRLREEVELHTIYTDDDIQKIMNYLKGKDTPRHSQLLHYIRFLYYTCIRPKEIAMLKVGDIRTDTKTIIIPAKVSKGGRSEPVDISPGLADLLSEMELKGKPADWYIFGNQGRGVPGDYADPKPGPKPVGPNYFTKLYREVMKDLGYTEAHTLYGWKHTRNVHLYLQDKDLLRIMRHNRHTDPKVTMKYLRSLGILLDHRITDERRI